MAASSTAIGSSSIILSVNADPLVNGLGTGGRAVNQWAANTKAKAESTRQALDKQFKSTGSLVSQVTSAVGGGVGSQLGAGLAGGLAGGLAALGVVGAQAFANMATGANKFAAELERGERLTAALAQAADRSAKMAGERLGAAATPDAQLAELDRQLKAVDANLPGLGAAADRARKELEGLKDTLSADNFGKNTQLWLGGGLANAIKEAEARVKELDDRVAKARNQKVDLGIQRDRLVNPMNDPAFVGDMARLNAELDKQVMTWGLSSNAAKVYELRLRDMTGAASEALDKLDLAARAADDAIQERETNKLFTETIKALDMEAASIGKTADQIKLLEFAEKGFTKVQLGEVEKRLQANARLREAMDMPKLAGAFTSGSAEAYSIVAKFQTGASGQFDTSKQLLREQQEGNRLAKEMLDVVKGHRFETI